jgi:hypothetical protein
LGAERKVVIRLHFDLFTRQWLLIWDCRSHVIGKVRAIAPVS